MKIEQFKKLPLMGILRDVEAEVLEPLTETIITAGLKTVEITMNTTAAATLIRHMKDKAGNSLSVGAGTVLSLDDARRACAAGAQFIVMPVLVRDVMDYCVREGIPAFPGALTPTEILEAWRSGATMVKVFPASHFGPAYFNEVRGPFRDIGLLACGGVTVENLSRFFSCGAQAVAFGGSVFKKKWLDDRHFSYIGDVIKDLVTAFERYYNDTGNAID
ncbi:MAG: bifunctional 4-hydroxy-2-oxoglutarate aldolase/2-dehydro-3-deoxy-phosphogluconate aldolase [Candidatus Omnitrophica bacterium]|nr:bifunctional 4-hydroxy-2-oxoglutarate aldolase/2-dehydro-3-deoxy-phosphogluconate aldolase [Candidatus Omnitrophota bacterium]